VRHSLAPGIILFFGRGRRSSVACLRHRKPWLRVCSAPPKFKPHFCRMRFECLMPIFSPLPFYNQQNTQHVMYSLVYWLMRVCSIHLRGRIRGLRHGKYRNLSRSSGKYRSKNLLVVGVLLCVGKCKSNVYFTETCFHCEWSVRTQGSVCST
jgi:hypothetical protein